MKMGLLIQVEQPQHEPFFFRFVMGKAQSVIEENGKSELPSSNSAARRHYRPRDGVAE
jgi:hypothetical protein